MSYYFNTIVSSDFESVREKVIEELKKLGREDIMVIVGGVIPSQDYDFLYKAGAAAVFGPGSIISECASKMLELLIETHK